MNHENSIISTLISSDVQAPAMLLLTGESGAGKTSFCQKLIQQAHGAGFAPVGLLSPAVFESDSKIAIDLMNIASGERRRLAERREKSSDVLEASLVTYNWQFDPSVLSWGNRILDEIGYAQLFILDEVGPLELLENRGFISGLHIIDRMHFRLACVVVRPQLLTTAQERWPWGVVLDLSGSILS